jgi:hypothetical protein
MITLSTAMAEKVPARSLVSNWVFVHMSGAWSAREPVFTNVTASKLRYEKSLLSDVVPVLLRACFGANTVKAHILDFC